MKRWPPVSKAVNGFHGSRQLVAENCLIDSCRHFVVISSKQPRVVWVDGERQSGDTFRVTYQVRSTRKLTRIHAIQFISASKKADSWPKNASLCSTDSHL